MDAFTITRHAGVLESQAPRIGENILTNGDFERGDFTGYGTTTNWSVIAANSVTPNGADNFMAQAASALANGTITRATLETNKFAVIGDTEYLVRVAYGAPLVGDTALNDSPNSLRVAVRWYDAGNNLLATKNLMNERVEGSQTMGTLYGRAFSPSAATQATLYLVNRHADLNNALQAGGTVLDELFVTANVAVTTPPLIETLQYNRVNTFGYNGLKYSNHFQQGFKQCEFTLHGSPEYLWEWMTRAFQNHIEVHYDNVTVFEGMVYAMEGVIGGKKYQISMDALANYVVIAYKDNKHFSLSNRASMKRWGRKDYYETVKGGRELARDRAEYLLAVMSNPRPRLVDTIGDTGRTDYVKVTVMGYYTTLTFIKNLRWHAARKVDAAVAIAKGTRSLLNNVRANTPNDWLSTDWSWVNNTGRNVNPPTRKDVEGKSVADLIQTYLQRGTSNVRTICAGVWENRRWRMEERPTAARYQLRQGKAGSMNLLQGGARIPLPLVRAGEYVRVPPPIPTWRESFSDIEDDYTSAFFLKEVEFDAEKNSLRMVSPNAEPLELKIGRAVRATR